MILKYPMVLLLLIPVIALFAYFRTVKITHAIRFPKGAWLAPLASKRGARLLRLTTILECAVLILCVLALAQPQWVKAKRYSTKAGIDIVAMLDTSGSMNAEDFKPKNRMEVAKETLNQFIKKRKDDRVGLIIFCNDALTKAPLTYDHGILTHHIRQTTVGDAGEGTAIGLAIATGLNRLKGAKAVSKIMILITDGVNNSGQIDPISAATLAKEKGIKIYTIGIGTKEGAPIPIYHPTYGKTYARYPNGQLQMTEFDDTVLKSIAEMTNGKYFNATNTNELNNVYNEINDLEKTIIQTTKEWVVFDWFPAIIGLILCLIVIKEVIVLTRLVGVRT